MVKKESIQPSFNLIKLSQENDNSSKPGGAECPGSQSPKALDKVSADEGLWYNH